MLIVDIGSAAYLLIDLIPVNCGCLFWLFHCFPLAVPVCDASAQYAVHFTIWYPDFSVLNDDVYLFDQLLLTAFNRQFASVFNERFVSFTSNSVYPFLLPSLQIAPGFVGLKQLAVYSDMVFHE